MVKQQIQTQDSSRAIQTLRGGGVETNNIIVVSLHNRTAGRRGWPTLVCDKRDRATTQSSQ